MNLLQEKTPETDLINDINELPSLSEFDEDKEEEKLLIVDDFIERF